MKITREDVLRVAELAYLDLTEAEIETYSRQLDSILTYADKLNQLDTENVAPMTQVVPPGASAEAARSATPLREDVIQPCEVIGEVLSGAPDATESHFRVPKVIER
jgi:aspartyl-tRNA(Asn)/glutamyl-tRNA(Gln) amidotransferase subunit C